SRAQTPPWPASGRCASPTPACAWRLSKQSKSRPRAGRRTASKAPSPRTRLIQQAEERAERLTTLSQLTRLITSATDSDAVFRGIAEAASTLLKAKMAYGWIDAGGERLKEARSEERRV